MMDGVVLRSCLPDRQPEIIFDVQLRRDYRWTLSNISSKRQCSCILATGVNSDSPEPVLAEHRGPSNLRVVFHGL